MPVVHSPLASAFGAREKLLVVQARFWRSWNWFQNSVLNVAADVRRRMLHAFGPSASSRRRLPCLPSSVLQPDKSRRGRERLRSASRPGSQRVARTAVPANFHDAGALHLLRPETGRGPSVWTTRPGGPAARLLPRSGKVGHVALRAPENVDNEQEIPADSEKSPIDF